MLAGILAGITWAVATYVLTLATEMEIFSAESLIFVTLVSTFIHDASSAIWATLYNTVKGNIKNVWNALIKTKSGKWVVIAALIGGPIGMTGYVMSVTYMGAAIGAVASAIFPAIGSVLAYIFLKEKMKWYQWVFLAITILGVYGLSFDGSLSGTNYWLGILGALMCSFGWGIEAVILAKCLKDPEVKDEYALQIRQTTSALTYGIIILPVIKGWEFTSSLFKGENTVSFSKIAVGEAFSGFEIIVGCLPVIILAGLFATISYLYYYKAISRIGASKAMALNVTYVAWIALIPLALVLFGGVMPTYSMPQIFCTATVLICGVFAAADVKELFASKKSSQ